MTTSRKILHGSSRFSVPGYWLVSLFIAFSVSGCGLNRAVAVKASEPVEKRQVDRPQEKKTDSGKTGKADPIAGSRNAAATTERKARGDEKSRKREAEDLQEKLRDAANKLALKHGSIEAMKLCYVEHDNEWWATLYQDIGPVVDELNYIWNWEEQRFKRFLVVRHFPKNELHKKVNRHERGWRCTILKAPREKSTRTPEKRVRKKSNSGKTQ